MFISSETDLCGRVTCNRQWRRFLLRSLTETLHGIEREGLIERNLRPVAPPQVEYPLTEMGATYSFRSRTCVIGRRPTFLNARPAAIGMTRSNWARSQALQLGNSIAAPTEPFPVDWA